MTSITRNKIEVKNKSWFMSRVYCITIRFASCEALAVSLSHSFFYD